MCAWVARELRHREARAAKRGGVRASLRLREVTDLFPTLSEGAIRAKVKERLPDVEAQRVRARPRSPCSPVCESASACMAKQCSPGPSGVAKVGGCKRVLLCVAKPQGPQLCISCPVAWQQRTS